MRRCFVYTVVLACFVTIFASLGFPQAPPSADAYVTTAMPGSNFGSSPILPVQAGTTSFLQLNLGAFPANAKVAKATLRLYVDAVTAPGSFDVYAVSGNWSERGLSANTAPALGASASGGQSIAITKASVNQFVLVDITSLVQGWLDGSITNHGVALALIGSEGSFAFDSKESSGHHPELEVVLGNTELLATGTSEAAAGTTTAANHAISAVAGVNAVVTPGVSPYINNQTTQQTGANFNIDGNGTAGSFNSTSTYQIGGTSVFSIGAPSDSNLFLGANAGTNNVAGVGQFNVFAGAGAGNTNTTGVSNMFLGTGAGQLNSTGSYNTFIGTYSGAANTTGHHNIFVGTGAGAAETTGNFNTFFGVNAGLGTTTASQNTFFGGGAGLANTTGSVNVFFGTGAGESNTTGSGNVYIGSYAGYKADPTSSNNLYLGTQGSAGESNTLRLGDQGTQTAAYIAGVNGATTAGGSLVFIDSTGKLGTFGSPSGYVTSFNGRSGPVFPMPNDYNFGQISGTVTGPQLGGTYANIVSFPNTANAFTGNGSGLTAVNAQTLQGFGPGHFAPNAGSPNYIQSNPSAPQNANLNINGTAIVGSGLSAMSLPNNVAIQAQDNNTTGTSEALDAQTQNPGANAIHGQNQATTGQGIGVLGETKGPTGAGTIGVNDGTSGAGYGVVGYSGSTSGFGVAGASPGVATAGFTQTCTDLNACTLTTGIAGQFVTMTGGTLLQGLSGANLTSLAPVFSVDSNGNVQGAGIWKNSITGGVQVYVDSAGHLGVNTSSVRFKEQIRDMGSSSSALMQLRPVTFHYKPQFDDGSHALQFGLIAEEVAKVMPDMVVYDSAGAPYTVKYQFLAPMLLNELQKQNAVVSAQQQVIEKLQAQNADMQQRLTRLEKLLLQAEQ